MNLEDRYIELQYAKQEVISMVRKQRADSMESSLKKLEKACEKLCFDYESELEHCMDIAKEEALCVSQ